MARSSALAIAAGLALAGVAQAQTAPAPADDQEVEEVVVTGTSIRGVAVVGQPVTGLGAEEIKAVGAANLAQAARTLPVVMNLGADESRTGGAQDAAANSSRISAINLRGLGPEATLLLLNGRRMARRRAPRAVRPEHDLGRRHRTAGSRARRQLGGLRRRRGGRRGQHHHAAPVRRGGDLGPLRRGRRPRREIPVPDVRQDLVDGRRLHRPGGLRPQQPRARRPRVPHPGPAALRRHGPAVHPGLCPEHRGRRRAPALPDLHRRAEPVRHHGRRFPAAPEAPERLPLRPPGRQRRHPGLVRGLLLPAPDHHRERAAGRQLQRPFDEPVLRPRRPGRGAQRQPDRRVPPAPRRREERGQGGRRPERSRRPVGPAGRLAGERLLRPQLRRGGDRPRRRAAQQLRHPHRAPGFQSGDGAERLRRPDQRRGLFPDHRLPPAEDRRVAGACGGQVRRPALRPAGRQGPRRRRRRLRGRLVPLPGVPERPFGHEHAVDHERPQEPPPDQLGLRRALRADRIRRQRHAVRPAARPVAGRPHRRLFGLRPHHQPQGRARVGSRWTASRSAAPGAPRSAHPRWWTPAT
ncbi:TonB-dependent receptor plug domain-containing protein [Phenylobacterium sp. J367]|uniref:TonB-dependent receptor plug domain-containing protein n=1 Tax=Phenylobacterium sp. J367 TaxID=2898435 RepID=UPI0035B46092